MSGVKNEVRESYYETTSLSIEKNAETEIKSETMTQTTSAVGMSRTNEHFV
jgi:hypothetical protein